MKLSERLETISPEQTVTELNSLLERAKVSINWKGRRLVHVKGDEDCVEINELAEKYLTSSVFQNPDAPMNEKSECFELWNKLKGLFDESEKELGKTWFYKYITPSLIDFKRSPFATLVICDDGGIGYHKKTSLL